MVSYKIIYKEQKLKADYLILLTILILYLVLFIFFKLIAILGILVFPMIFLIINGCVKLYGVFFMRFEENPHKIQNFIYGLFSIPFGSFFLFLIFTHPTIHPGYIIYFIAIILIIIGSSGIFKGIVVNAFTKKSRIINIIIGFLSIIFSFISCVYSQELFFLNLVSHSFLLFFNLIGRCMLYLSEFEIHLSDLRKKNMLKFLLQIIIEPPYIIEFFS